MWATPSEETLARARQDVAEVAKTLAAGLSALSEALQEELAELIPELRGDPLILELLRASIESNVETFLQFARGSVALEDVAPPSSAVAYARRLAQRGTSSAALLRAYRLGQQRVVQLAFAEIGREEPEPEVAYLAAQLVHESAFAYVDRVAEQVVVEYESERERWLANRNSVRAAALTALIDGEDLDLATSENALGYRLRQCHLGLVAWDTDHESSTSVLRSLESLLNAVGEVVGGVGQPLFIPQDGSLAWAWVPLGPEAPNLDLTSISRLVADAGSQLRVAMGTPAPSVAGFRSTHLEALRAYAVANVAGEQADLVTTYAEPGVRAASLLTGDLASARDLVADALGGLAADDESAARLRETLLAFLSENGSYLATAERIHVHKNTVKYRVDRAVEVRGRALDDDRFNLELALLACRWLGRSVLAR